MNKIDEKELKEIFIKLKNKEPDGMNLFYEKCHDLIYGISFSILKNKENSEDVSQEVFTKILKLDVEKIPSQGEVSWIYTVTKNEVFQFLRKQKQNLDIDELYTLESESDEIDDIVDMNSYYKLIENLKPIDKEIISLRILSDFTFEKIAQMLNLSLGTVQWRYYKSLHSIKLSLSNLAAFLVVFGTWNTLKKFAFATYSSENSMESDISMSNKSENSIADMHKEGQSSYDEIFVAQDTSGASESVVYTVNYIFNLAFFSISLIFIILTVFFAIRKKIKVKRKNK